MFMHNIHCLFTPLHRVLQWWHSHLTKDVGLQLCPIINHKRKNCKWSTACTAWLLCKSSHNCYYSGVVWIYEIIKHGSWHNLDIMGMSLSTELPVWHNTFIQKLTTECLVKFHGKGTVCKMAIQETEQNVLWEKWKMG